MRSAALAAALLFAAVGLAIGCAGGRTRTWCLAALAVAGIAAARAPIPACWREAAFFGVWVATAAAAAAAHLPKGPPGIAAIALSAGAGLCAGAAIAAAGTPMDLIAALPCALAFAPAAMCIGAGRSIAIRIAASWLIAIAVLAAALQLLPVTPGYLPDHLE